MARHEPVWRETFRNEVTNSVEYECERCRRTCTCTIEPPQLPSLAEH